MEAPPEIVVWNPSEEQEPPLVEEQPTAPSTDSEKNPLDTKTLPEEPTLDTNTDVDNNEVNHNDQFWGFLLIPCLVFSSVLIGLGSDFESIGCEHRGRHIAFGSITLNGADYDLYTYHYEDLERVSTGWHEDEDCELSDWFLSKADYVDLMVRTNEYDAENTCKATTNNCDGAFFEHGNDWIPMVMRNAGNQDIPDGYFAIEDGGLLGDAYFAVAVKPSVEISEFEARATSDPSVPQLIFSIVLTPAALLFANRWAVANDRPDVRAGAMAFAKIVFRVAWVFVPVFMCLIFLTLLTW